MKIKILNKKKSSEIDAKQIKTYENSKMVKTLHDLVFGKTFSSFRFFLGHFQVSGCLFFFFFFFLNVLRTN